MPAIEDLLVCTACGTQFSVDASSKKSSCRICDDPRQFVPPSGQKFTTLRDMKGIYQNKWMQDEFDERIWSIWTEPKASIHRSLQFAIGQRCLLLRTPHGNILWDLITYLDEPTINWINSLGGLTAILISHPHYYTTHAYWASTFGCPVYTHSEDSFWLEPVTRFPSPVANADCRLIKGATEEIVRGVTGVRCGGHFDGSLVCHWQDAKSLFIADTLVTAPSALNPHTESSTPAPGTGRNSYSFLWSIPNMIPLPPTAIQKIWEALRPFEFEQTYGAFVGTDVRDKQCKERVLESMKIVVRGMGWHDVQILTENMP
ncbi:MAG: hypothetical protein M1834_005938 [Cirrosporium novae-zelandiae]|nr:MAG: hypothetical protein M1834_005938 [Cirrosporium novae-zelandiae]